MTSNVIASLTVSLDGYAAGPNQSLENPFGEGVDDKLHRWMFEDSASNAAETEALNSHGAYIMGRNMFGPGRGEWNLDWRGWWGDEPPYHAPVFVLTHHARQPLQMQGGTTFTFETDGIVAALHKAQEAANGRSVSIAGGANVVRQYLTAGLVNELHLSVAPVILGAGESWFAGLPPMQFEQIGSRHTRYVTHLQFRVPRTD